MEPVAVPTLGYLCFAFGMAMIPLTALILRALKPPSNGNGSTNDSKDIAVLKEQHKNMSERVDDIKTELGTVHGLVLQVLHKGKTL